MPLLLARSRQVSHLALFRRRRKRGDCTESPSVDSGMPPKSRPPSPSLPLPTRPTSPEQWLRSMVVWSWQGCETPPPRDQRSPKEMGVACRKLRRGCRPRRPGRKLAPGGELKTSRIKLVRARARIRFPTFPQPLNCTWLCGRPYGELQGIVDLGRARPPFARQHHENVLRRPL